MTRRHGAVRGWAIAAIVLGILVAAASLLLPNGKASLQIMPSSIENGGPPPAMVTTCASPLSTGPAYARVDAGKGAIDCAALVSRRRWTAGVAGLVALLGVGVLMGLRRSKTSVDRTESIDTPNATTPS